MFNPLEYVVLLIVIALITYLRKALDLFGSIFMIIMGIVIIFTAGANWLILNIHFPDSWTYFYQIQTPIQKRYRYL